MTKATETNRYEPDYTRKCENCGQTPVVLGMSNGKVAYRGTMCGPCTWGEADMRDPDEWNK